MRGSPALLTTRSWPLTAAAASGPAAISRRKAVGAPARLVMPWLLIKSLQDAGVTEPAALAERLRVSKQAMTYRLGLPYDQNWT